MPASKNPSRKKFLKLSFRSSDTSINISELEGTAPCGELVAFSRLEGPSDPLDTTPPPQVTLLSCIPLLAPYGNVKNVPFLNLCHMTPLFGPQCSGQWTVYSGQWTVDSGQWTVDSGQGTVDC